MHEVIVQPKRDIIIEPPLQENNLDASPNQHEEVHEEIDEDKFWDDLESFFSNIDIKPSYLAKLEDHE